MTRIARMKETKIFRFIPCDFIRVIRVIRGWKLRFVRGCPKINIFTIQTKAEVE